MVWGVGVGWGGPGVAGGLVGALPRGEVARLFGTGGWHGSVPCREDTTLRALTSPPPRAPALAPRSASPRGDRLVVHPLDFRLRRDLHRSRDLLRGHDQPLQRGARPRSRLLPPFVPQACPGIPWRLRPPFTIRTRLHARTHARTRNAHTHAHTPTPTPTHPPTHPHTHTHTHTQTHTPPPGASGRRRRLDLRAPPR